ncbi:MULTISPECIES: DUF397 domain-containing protein [unclassified Streptomyces]|uniref:DUF397 domain-containing protein n=1 Tax=unclassified Streptomyces TaxID=2593676 RepID=UPI0016606BF6|nr:MULTISPECIES: DUF397 domain-containing protein [unclassified Streptomyces]MBD0707241.1 DUF397 domain-containing protein [Streptomyces sp. CBMA291]MBD0713729.1 DUF397 domain-containing protein [Streptomyces sp. CBMA370]
MSTAELTWFKSSYSSSEGGECIEVAYQWRKSSYSDSEGGNCVEVGYDWYKSSYSGPEGGECVEVAAHPAAVHIRDSKNPEGPQLAVSPASWTAFVGVTTSV